MYGLLYECKFLTIEETNKKKKNDMVILLIETITHIEERLRLDFFIFIAPM